MKRRLKKILLSTCCLYAVAAVGGTFVTTTRAEGSPSLALKGETVAYKPDIYVDFGEYSSENIPAAVKGSKYALFPATAEDLYGNTVPVQVKVYLHYLESNQSFVTVRDNAVTPTHYGIYTVEYTARDTYGNIQTLLYKFNCDERAPLSISLSAAATETLVGREVRIATPNVENAIGNYAVKITATSEDGKTVYDLTGKDMFVPTYASNYTLTYEVSDYSCTQTASYQIQAQKHDQPIVWEEPTLNKYFIVGKQYVLPMATAYQFSTGRAVEVVPKIEVGYGNERKSVLGGDRTFTPQKEDDLTIIYTFTYDKNSVVKTYLAKAVDVGYTSAENFDATKYFYSEKALIKANSNLMTVETETENTEVEFINSLISQKFNFNCSFAKNGNHFSQLDFYLTDSIDKTVQLKCSLIKYSENECILRVNDGIELKTNASFYSTNSMQFVYSEQNGNVLSLGNISITPTTDLIGKTFKGFPSGKVYFSYTIKGVEGRVKLNMNAIGNQPLFRLGGDSIEPMLVFKAYDGNKCKIGDLITVDRMYLQDVLDPEYSMEYSITTPSGEYVIDENGVLLDEQHANYERSYVFRARELGSYSVNMQVSDSQGNKVTYAYAIVVEDCDAPIVELKEKPQTEIAKGESFTIQDLVITDDHSLECSVHVCVLAPNLISYEVNVGDTFTAKTVGKYTVCYTVVDEAGNTAFIRYEIKVV